MARTGPEKDYFPKLLLEPGMAFKSETKYGFIRFVTFYHEDAIFEYWDVDRYRDGSSRGSVSQKFSIFSTDCLERLPEKDDLQT